MLDDAASDEEEKADRAMRARRMKRVENEISQVPARCPGEHPENMGAI